MRPRTPTASGELRARAHRRDRDSINGMQSFRSSVEIGDLCGFFGFRLDAVGLVCRYVDASGEAHVEQLARQVPGRGMIQEKVIEANPNRRRKAEGTVKAAR